MLSAQYNHVQLEKLLTIEDPHKETIYGVVGRMKVLLDLFKADPQLHGLIPFLITYYYVTKKAAEKYLTNKHYFWSVKDYETLDVYFASLYFRPLLGFLLAGKSETPWKNYFEYCKTPDGKPFLQLILGINAHINSDLYHAILYLRYTHQQDFFLVNDILQEVIPEVVHFLAFEKHDLAAILGLFFRDLTTVEYHNVVEKWRSVAWANAQLTSSKNMKENLEKIEDKTENLAVNLIQNFTQTSHISAILTNDDSFTVQL